VKAWGEFVLSDVSNYFRGPEPFGCVLVGDLDLFVRIQGFESVRLDCCVVDENVEVPTLDEPVSLLIVEPLYDSNGCFRRDL